MRKRILCYGDSNTWGYMPGIGTRYEEDVRYPGVLAAELGQAYRVVEEAAGEGQAHPGHQGAGAVILLVSPVPIHPENDPMFARESWKKSRELEPVYRELAENYGCLYLDAGAVPGDLGEDGIHLNAGGHRDIGKAIAVIIKENEQRE